MPKPFSLSLYTSALNGTAQTFLAPLTSRARGWKRSIRSMGGCWQGSFNLDGTPAQLQEAFETWLGCEVRERAGGFLSWAGLIYEMDLQSGGVQRRRSLDLMANRVKTTYATNDWISDNFVEHPGFEEFNVGVTNDDFFAWSEQNGTNGSVKAASGVGMAHSGTYSVALTGDTDAPGADGMNLTRIWQNVNVTPGAKYRLSFWTRGDGGAASTGGYGWMCLRNPNGGNHQMIGPVMTFYKDAGWIRKMYYFDGPSQGEVMLFFTAPDDDGRIAYFDDVEIKESMPTIYETPWAEVEDARGGGPIGRYGCKEEVIHLDSYPLETSLAYRDTYLAEHAWPWMRPVGVGNKSEYTLDVSVCGYVFTMNWQYIQEGDSSEDDVDDWLIEMVGTTEGRSHNHGGTSTTAGDCQFVSTGAVDANTLQVPKASNVETRPWDTIQELASLGDANGAPWRAWVGPSRKFHYRPIDTAPRYYIRKDGIFDTMAGRVPSNPWLMQPAVFRDMTYRSTHDEPGSFLTSARDIYVEEVEMSDGAKQPTLKTTLFSEADLLRARTERGE